MHTPNSDMTVVALWLLAVNDGCAGGACADLEDMATKSRISAATENMLFERILLLAEIRDLGVGDRP